MNVIQRYFANKTHLFLGMLLIHYENFGLAAKLAVPTPDHYYPLLYSLGLQAENEEVRIFNDKLMAGSLTMTSLLIH